MTELEEQLVSELRKQTAAMEALTESNKRLANSIAMLAGAIAEQMDEEPISAPKYLDGSSAT